jgi:hypothetical protein
MLSVLSDRLIQKLVSKDEIRVAIGKSTLHSPPMCCHLKLFMATRTVPKAVTIGFKTGEAGVWMPPIEIENYE